MVLVEVSVSGTKVCSFIESALSEVM